MNNRLFANAGNRYTTGLIVFPVALPFVASVLLLAKQCRALFSGLIAVW